MHEIATDDYLEASRRRVDAGELRDQLGGKKEEAFQVHSADVDSRRTTLAEMTSEKPKRGDNSTYVSARNTYNSAVSKAAGSRRDYIDASKSYEDSADAYQHAAAQEHLASTNYQASAKEVLKLADENQFRYGNDLLFLQACGKAGADPSTCDKYEGKPNELNRDLEDAAQQFEDARDDFEKTAQQMDQSNINRNFSREVSAAAPQETTDIKEAARADNESFQAQEDDFKRIATQEEIAKNKDENIFGPEGRSETPVPPIETPSGPLGGQAGAGGGGGRGSGEDGLERSPEEKEAYLNEILQENPNNSAARSARSVINSLKGNHAAACSDARAALAIDPNDKRAHSVSRLSCSSINMGGLGLNTDGHESRKASAQNDLLAANTAGGAGFSRGFQPAAGAPPSRGFGRRVPQNVEESYYQTKQSQKSMRSRDFDRAIEYASRAIEMNPNNAGAYFMRASARNAMKDYRNAMRDAIKGLRLKPGNIQLMNTLSLAQARSGDYTSAAETARRAISAHPTNAAAYANLAFALSNLGDRQGALDALRKAASLNPSFDQSLQELMESPPDAEFPFFFPGEERPADSTAKSTGIPGWKKLLMAFFMTVVLLGLLVGVAPLLRGGKTTLSGTTAGGEAEAASPEQLAGAAAAVAAVPSGDDGGGTKMETGTLIGGNYELGEKIGEGGMGYVFKAYDKKLDRTVALKRMLPELKNSPRDLERFIKEAKIVSHISHPYIVGIHDILQQDGDIFLVFDYVDGAPLSKIIDEKGRLPIGECQTYFTQICQAMGHAHKNNVLHRDLKPANIMIDKTGFAKVMDFGIAREAKDSISRLTQKDTSGTPAYMAPEQHLGTAGKPADIFSIGVCLYEALTGELPFRGPDFLAQKERMMFKPPTKIISSLPKGIDVLMTAVLQGDPAKRIADTDELRESIANL